MGKMPYVFKELLISGIIKKRRNRFIMEVAIGNDLVDCHCPSTGGIGSVNFGSIPCLLSCCSPNEKRKTAYTVEAISLNAGDSWIGINQCRANDYVEHFIQSGQLTELLGIEAGICVREKKLGNSRIDFWVRDPLKGNEAYMEIKMPLTYFSLENTVKRPPTSHKSPAFFERLIRHYSDLTQIVGSQSKALVVLCYFYDALPFSPPARNKWNAAIHDAVTKAKKKNVQLWQINFSITPQEVNLMHFFQIR